LQRVAQLTVRRPEPSLATMHSATVGVADRLLALETDVVRVTWHRLLAPAVLVAGAVAVALIAAERSLDLFQLAHALATLTDAG
jgi:hypothetical protein